MIAESRFSLTSNRLPYCPIFFAVNPYSGVHSPLGEFTRLGKVTSIRLGVRSERKPIVLRISCVPVLLFSHGCGVRADKGESIENIVERWINESRLRLVNDAPRFVEAL